MFQNPRYYFGMRVYAYGRPAVTLCDIVSRSEDVFEESQVVRVEVEIYHCGRFRVRGIDFRWFQHLRRPPKVASGHLENVTRCHARNFENFGRSANILKIVP